MFAASVYPSWVYGQFSGAMSPIVSAGLNLPGVNASAGRPAGLIHLDPEVRYLFWVDLTEGAMYLLENGENGQLKQLEVVPVSIGKQGYGKLKEGDLRTPVGAYHITSYLKDSQLAEKYGNGAYPLNYPNMWDRLRKRTGSGIWLHGLPKGVDSRPRLDSDGCVVISNESLDEYDAFITEGETMMVLADELNWTTETGSNGLMETFQGWLSAWQSLDNDAYLDFYGSEFSDLRRNLAQWKTYKTRVNGNKKWVKVGVSKLSVMNYPGETDLAVMRFHQDYESSNYRWEGWKYLLWRFQDGEWKIVYEGNG